MLSVASYQPPVQCIGRCGPSASFLSVPVVSFDQPQADDGGHRAPTSHTPVRGCSEEKELGESAFPPFPSSAASEALSVNEEGLILLCPL